MVVKPVVTASYVQKLVTGDISLLKALESFAEVKLFMHLCNSVSISTQKESIKNWSEQQSTCTKDTQKVHKSKKVDFLARSIHQGTNLTESNNEIKNYAKPNLITKSFIGIQLKKHSLENHKNKNNFKILILNDDNFRSATLKYELLLVMFYAPWCKYCNDMKPMFHRAAKELPKYVGNLAYCNGETAIKATLEHNVYVYPTLKLFRGGKYLTDYVGPRRSLELVKFMIKHSQQNN